MVSLYLHFYWCSKLQIAFSSFCLCLCVEETEKKILICSSWPYINHYSEVKWCELDSSLNKTSGGRQGTLEAVLSLELFWKFCFFKWVQCLLLYCAKLELTLMQKKYTQKQDLSRLHSAFLLTHCQEHVLYITYYTGLHSSWSDTLITLLFSAQVQYGLDHYPSHFPIVTNSSHCTLRECNYLSVSELLCIRVAHLSPFSPLSLVSLSFKMSDCETMKFHCLCIYSLWSRDYWLYKVIQTDEWILYWLKCKYRLTLGSSHTARHTAAVFIVLHCQPEEQKCFP